MKANWKSINDEPPPIGARVLVWGKDFGLMETARLTDKIKFDAGEHFLWAQVHSLRSPGITHWAIAPEEIEPPQ